MEKRGQIWVETVIYILIGLVLIGLVLTIINPRINEYKDRIVIEQTIESMNAFDIKINEVLSAPGNVRIVEFELNRGDFYVDGVNDEIRFELVNSRSLFSESDVLINFGSITIETTEGAKFHKVELKMKYLIDIKSEGLNEEKKYTAVSVPYRFQIENFGPPSPGLPAEVHISDIS